MFSNDTTKMLPTRRVLITGPESSGKSELSASLAHNLRTRWVPEYARTYLSTLPRSYTRSDLDAILTGQLRWETATATETRHHYLFCDTGPEVVYIWSRVKYGAISPLIESITQQHHYDQIFLCYPDLPWTADPLREAPAAAERLALFDLYVGLLEQLGRPYEVVRGVGEARLELVLSLLR